MSMLNRPADGAAVGEIVATTTDYVKAQKTVSQLISADVPARDIAIVGQGVRTVERVTGRLGYATAARSGAVNGVLIGLLLSAVMVLGTPDAPIQLFVGFILIGVAIGMVLSLVTFAIVRRRRDFASVTQLAAERYEVTVMPTSLSKARQALGGQRPAPARPAADLSEPPRYGERVNGQGVNGPSASGQGSGSSAPVGGAPRATAAAPSDPPRYGERVVQPSQPAQPAVPPPAVQPPAVPPVQPPAVQPPPVQPVQPPVVPADAPAPGSPGPTEDDRRSDA